MRWRGNMGLLLTKCNLSYPKALELVDLLEVMAKKHGYEIRVVKHKRNKVQ